MIIFVWHQNNNSKSKGSKSFSFVTFQDRLYRSVQFARYQTLITVKYRVSPGHTKGSSHSHKSALWEPDKAGFGLGWTGMRGKARVTGRSGTVATSRSGVRAYRGPHEELIQEANRCFLLPTQITLVCRELPPALDNTILNPYTTVTKQGFQRKKNKVGLKSKI